MSEETDWLDAYNAIKSASYAGAALNAGKRVAGLPLDVATDGLKAVRSLVSATGLAQNGLALAGGFAGVGKLQEIATKNITDPATKAAVSQLTNMAGSAGVLRPDHRSGRNRSRSKKPSRSCRIRLNRRRRVRPAMSLTRLSSWPRRALTRVVKRLLRRGHPCVTHYVVAMLVSRTSKRVALPRVHRARCRSSQDAHKRFPP